MVALVSVVSPSTAPHREPRQQQFATKSSRKQTMSFWQMVLLIASVLQMCRSDTALTWKSLWLKSHAPTAAVQLGHCRLAYDELSRIRRWRFWGVTASLGTWTESTARLSSELKLDLWFYDLSLKLILSFPSFSVQQHKFHASFCSRVRNLSIKHLKISLNGCIWTFCSWVNLDYA